MPRYPALPDHVREALGSIVASGDEYLWYFPCRVTLPDGRVIDTVYIEPEVPYLRQWGVYPEDDRGKRSVKIEDVVKVEDSPTRLPARFANQIYDHGECGMGYTIFTVLFFDGTRQACITGGAVDFVRYPNGKGPNDVAAVLPHEGRNAQLAGAPEWYWCLYSGEPFRPIRTAVHESGGLGAIMETLEIEDCVIQCDIDLRIFKRRLDHLIRGGIARQIPPPAGVDGRGYEWYLDVPTGEVYRYGPPSPPASDDSRNFGRWERVDSGELGTAIQ